MLNKLLVILLLLVAFGGPPPSGIAVEPLRLITAGWNAPTLGQFARDVEKMSGGVPLTGCVMTLHADSGDPNPFAAAHGTEDWSALDTDRSITACSRAPKQEMPDGYLLLKTNPGSVDWLDDDGWTKIVEHYRIAARLARQAGLRGLLIDFEPYTEPYRQFQYAKQASAAERTFAEYRDAARKRGHAVMNAIAGEFPDCELGTFFLLSYLIEDHHYRGPSPVDRSDAEWCLAGHTYGLLPAFLDGWMDAVPEGMTIIDGCENAYWFTTPEQFHLHAEAVRKLGAELLSQPNREKYRRQVKVAMPVFLDAIHPTLGGEYKIEPERTDRLAMLRRNLSAAIDASDGFVWLYGERGRWWPEAGGEALWSGKDVYPAWEAQWSGVSDVIHDVVSASNHDRLKRNALSPPSESALQASEEIDVDVQQGDDEQAGDSSEGEDGEIEATVLEIEPTWNSHLHGDSGVAQVDAGQVRITSAADAYGAASYAVDPGNVYMIQAQVLQQGRGMTRMAIGWQTEEGEWIDSKQYDVVSYPPEGDFAQPRLLTAIVKSPPEPHQMVVKLGARWQLTDEDVALFGNLMIGIVDED